MTSEQIVVVVLIYFLYLELIIVLVFTNMLRVKQLIKKKKTKINLFVITACLNNKISKQRLYFSSV